MNDLAQRLGASCSLEEEISDAVAPVQSLFTITDQIKAEAVDFTSGVALVYDTPVMRGWRPMVVSLMPLRKAPDTLSPPRPWWLQAVSERLEHLARNTGPNWNSHGAREIQPGAVYLLARVLVAIMGAEPRRPLPNIVPTFRGGLQLEWHTGDADLEIDIDPRGIIEVSFEDWREQTEWAGTLGEREDAVRTTLDKMALRIAP